jgi:hypothetical protein
MLVEDSAAYPGTFLHLKNPRGSDNVMGPTQPDLRVKEAEARAARAEKELRLSEARLKLAREQADYWYQIATKGRLEESVD